MSNWSVQEFLQKAQTLCHAYLMLPWMIGDLCNEFADVRGEEAWQYIDDISGHMGISRDVLRDWMRVADVFEGSDRLGYAKSFWYFREVTSLGAPEGVKWVKRSIKEKWSYLELRKQVQAHKHNLTSSGGAITSSGLLRGTKTASQSRNPGKEVASEKALPGSDVKEMPWNS